MNSRRYLVFSPVSRLPLYGSLQGGIEKLKIAGMRAEPARLAG